MKRGFTLIELLVTMVIIFIVLAGAYIAFTNLLRGFKRESKSIETQVETSVGLELLRLDIEHAGYGIGEDQPDLPVEVSNVATSDTLYPNKEQLTIRSVMNNTNQSTVGWNLVDCSAGYTRIAGDDIPSGTNVVFLGAGNREYIADGTVGTCPGSGFYVAIPYDNTVTGGCITQYCNRISYVLSNSQNLSTCHPNTRNLLRAVGDGAGNPLLNCVADWRVRFDIDRNGDGSVDVYDGVFNSTTDTNDLDLDNDGLVTSQEVRSGLKKVNIYVLVQEGRIDPGFTFVNTVPCGTSPSGACVRTDTGAGSLDLNLPVDFQNYRWKVLKLFVKAMNL
ncbi:type IV pilus assembly protein PilW [Hydrogenivirga caldilitoris]|uniref:Type IV pilus assembly protein PilW n=1 Tax=Hydrogenivirga caldilitoris TaxID=246264 RepID=A0A497XV38_9AQUI|nr:type II secretion system protein [Hydrogenivirga caldilitoris]RLJ71022.1 type IV pilus assembly protein PilW [Hydrogenivirga caldilitoris]